MDEVEISWVIITRNLKIIDHPQELNKETAIDRENKKNNRDKRINKII